MGCEVKIIGFNFGDRAPLPSTADLPIISIPGSNYPQFFRSAQALLRQIDGDMVYAYKPKPTSFGLSLLRKLKTGCPLVLDIDDWEMSWHGGEDWSYRPRQSSWAEIF